MAKALFGHVGASTDLRLAAEVRRLRARVEELEVQLARTREAHEALLGSVRVDDDLSLLRLPDSEPAYS